MGAVSVTINEQSTAVLTVNFYDTDDALAAPTSFDWYIDDEDGNQVVAQQTVSSPSASHELTLLPEHNIILDDSKLVEVHILTVIATYGVSDGLTSYYRFGVRNINHVT